MCIYYLLLYIISNSVHSLLNNKVVLAKISPHTVRLEREFYVSKSLYSSPGGDRFVPNAIEYISLVQDGLAALIYSDVKPNDFFYFEQDNNINYFTLASLAQRTTTQYNAIWTQDQLDAIKKPKCNEVTLNVFLTFAVECCSALQFLHENGFVHGELRPSAFQVGHESDEEITAKVWNFGGGLNSYEELLLTSSRWRSFMSTSEVSSNTGNTNLIPTPPPPPPLPPSSHHLQQGQYIKSISKKYKDEEQSNYFTSDSNNSSSVAQPMSHNSSRFYSPKEFQSSLIYVSPEQTGRTSNVLDHRADLYSLGIMFFVILTDRPPFEGSAMDIVHSILSKNVPPVHTIRDDIPPVISAIIDKLTRKVLLARLYRRTNKILITLPRLSMKDMIALTD